MQSSLAREGKVDVRRDEEQNVKLSQIIKLLIDAGYYRARIKGLSPFDKIIGGMTWCIEVCNFDIDVDLLFHDSLTIGQKIALTERIVKVLPYMKCPFRIEPHQIQGLDSIHIFPVIQWLVKLAVETRAEYQDDTRIIALDEFNRHYSSFFAKPSREDTARRVKLLRKIKLKYGPKRRFKMTDKPESESEKILATLLEYSESSRAPQITVESDDESVEEDDKELQVKLSEKMLMDDNPDALFCVSSADLSSFKTRKELRQLEGATVDDRLHIMDHDVAELKSEVQVKSESLNRTVSEAEKLQEEMTEKREALLSLQAEVKRYEAVSSKVDEKTLEKMMTLIEENENAKKRASSFKEKCRQEAEVMKQRISELTVELQEPERAVDESLLALHKTELERLSTFRNQIGKKTREIEMLKRQIDDVPGRAEISQYQRRFVELYNLVRAEHRETLQFYNMYNTLADTRNYMDKEMALLNSLLDNLDQALSTNASLEEYLHQLENIIDGIKQNKIKLEKRRGEVKIERSSLSAELNRLQELQLLYARMLHQFSQEIAKNETLLERLES